MQTPSHRETATILAFPQRTQERRRLGLAGGNVIELAARQLPVVEFGSGWYHEAAMQEEASNKNN
jgi:hypothetical protein